MTDPGFRIQSVHQAAPFRARTTFVGYRVFGEGNWTVLVEPEAADGLRNAASGASPRETGGLLCGRTLRDQDGQYVLVSGFVEAGSGAGRSAAFEISPQQTAELREEAHRAYPTGDVVGWWHSHLANSPYSHTDLGTQAIFTQPDSVGLLVFARGEHWAMAYMGPESRRLGYSTVVQATGPARVEESRQIIADAAADRPVLSIPSPPAPGPPAGGSPADRPPAGGHRRWMPADRSQRMVRLLIFTEIALILSLILIVAVAIVVFGLPSQISALQRVSGQVNIGQQHVANQVGAMQQQLAGEIKGASTSAAAPPTISFACTSGLAHNGEYAGYFTCQATPSVSIGKILWYVDGKHAADGTTAKVSVRLAAGTHSVQAILEIAGSRYVAPAQQLP